MWELNPNTLIANQVACRWHHARVAISFLNRNLWQTKTIVDPTRFERMTLTLWVFCSTTELRVNVGDKIIRTFTNRPVLVVPWLWPLTTFWNYLPGDWCNRNTPTVWASSQNPTDVSCLEGRHNSIILYSLIALRAGHDPALTDWIPQVRYCYPDHLEERSL